MKPVVFLCGILRLKITKFKHIRKIVIVANMETGLWLREHAGNVDV